MRHSTCHIGSCTRHSEILYGDVSSVQCDGNKQIPPGLKNDYRPYLYCKNKKSSLLVDSGAQLCVVPRDPKIHKEIDPGIRIKGANNKPIPVYAIHRCTFRFREQTMRWLVLACDIDTAILGADFIDHFGIGILFHNHTFCIPGPNGQVQELAPFAARKS